MNNVPAGFHFYPTDDELALHYLALKARGALPDGGPVSDKDIYAGNPWDLFQDPKETYYVFTILKKHGKMCVRKAGDGTWKNQNNKSVQWKDKNGRKVIMYNKKGFSFDVKKQEEKDGHWIMTEYSLPQYQHEPNEIVLCKMRYNPSKDNGFGKRKGVVDSRDPGVSRREVITGDRPFIVPMDPWSRKEFLSHALPCSQFLLGVDAGTINVINGVINEQFVGQLSTQPKDG